MNTVKCRSKINKYSNKTLSVANASLKCLSQVKNLINTTSSGSEPCLLFACSFLSVSEQTFSDYRKKNLRDNREQTNASVISTDFFILLFENWSDDGIFHASGIASEFQIVTNKIVRILRRTCPPALITSVHIPSGPAALSLESLLMASDTSKFDGG